MAVPISFPSIKMTLLKNLEMTDIKALKPSLLREKARINSSIQVKKRTGSD